MFGQNVFCYNILVNLDDTLQKDLITRLNLRKHLYKTYLRLNLNKTWSECRISKLSLNMCPITRSPGQINKTNSLPLFSPHFKIKTFEVLNFVVKIKNICILTCGVSIMVTHESVPFSFPVTIKRFWLVLKAVPVSGSFSGSQRPTGSSRNLFKHIKFFINFVFQKLCP